MKRKYLQKETSHSKNLSAAKKRRAKVAKAIEQSLESCASAERIITRELRDEIEQRKCLEEKLQISELRFRRLFETAQDGILILDFKTGQITEANPFLVDLLGYTYKDLLGKKLWEIGVFKDIEASKSAFRQLQTKGYVRYEDLPLETKDGRSMEVEFVSNVYAVGHEKVIQCNIRDITSRAQLERIKEDIARKAWHEIKNPMSIIKEGLSLILNKIAGEINEDQRKMLVVIDNAIERTIRITSELLDFSKLENGKISLQRETINAKDLIKDAISFFELKIKVKGLEARVRLPEEEVNIYADKDKIFQVLSNLISNAVKFTEKGYIEVSVYAKADTVEFNVSDTGRGISRADLSKIFGKFEQFGELLNGKDKGIGLGLLIAKDIVELSNGRIWVESELGKGSKFSFTVPRAPKER